MFVYTQGIVIDLSVLLDANQESVAFEDVSMIALIEESIQKSVEVTICR